MKKQLIFGIFLLVGIFGYSQSVDQLLKSHWGFSVYGDFKVEKYNSANEVTDDKILSDKLPQQNGYHDFIQYNAKEQWSVGVLGQYTFYPMAKKEHPQLRPVFLRFALGGEFSKYGRNKEFLINSKMHVGYTFVIKKIQLDLYTGPSLKFSPYTHSYEDYWLGSIGESEMSSREPGVFTPETLPRLLYREFTLGASWNFGVVLRYKSVGLDIAYNQTFTGIEHIKWPKRPDYNMGYTSSVANNKYFNSLTVGLQFSF